MRWDRLFFFSGARCVSESSSEASSERAGSSASPDSAEGAARVGDSESGASEVDGSDVGASDVGEEWVPVEAAAPAASGSRGVAQPAIRSAQTKTSVAFPVRVSLRRWADPSSSLSCGPTAGLALGLGLGRTAGHG
jgi:hypothetical protein